MSVPNALTGFSVPAQQGPEEAVLIVLHGLGDTSRGWSMLPAELRLPSLSYKFFNAPEPYYNGYAWYDFFGNQGEGVRRSCALLHEAIGALEKQGITADKIGVLGFSQGCVMGFETVLRYPRRLGALVGISGYIFEPETLLREATPAGREVPILMTHGHQDPILPIDKSREHAQMVQQAGMALTWKEFRKAHNVAGAEEFNVIRAFLKSSLKLTRG
ncbi:MAG TPA: dienelactone hydrolase family protein [Candidatus Limnocylindria bacterium]|jgi:phospholipase/carboxylesterase|nr:dienelactone hydrolase family protein [Candidatus Limnocylindria bacterium]